MHPTAEECQLARDARGGSSEAFAGLVRLYHVRVYGFLLTLTRHRQDAEDLTQETFLRAWEKMRHYDPERLFLPWLLTIARRQSIAALRRPQPVPVDWTEETTTDPVERDRALWLWEVARRELLPQAYQALWLHYREELPLREVAEVLGKREGAVKVMLHRARKALAGHVQGLRGESDFSETYTSESTPTLQ